MQTTTQKISLTKSITIISTLLLASLSGQVQAEQTNEQLSMLEATNKWQVSRLLEPTQDERELEDKGYIMIYDNLPDKTVEKALDGNFERIENMMFTRVIITDDNGLPQRDASGNMVKEDDGC